jgi:hypothetical protein
MVRRSRFGVVAISFAVALPLLLSGSAHAAVPTYEFVTPLFGLAAAPNGNLFAADAGQGVVKLTADAGTLFAKLRGVDDVAPLGNGRLLAITGGGPKARDASLYRVVGGRKQRIASLGAYEAAKNPDGGEIDSNPYGVAALGANKALVADAAGNSVLHVNANGRVNWVATLPDELAPTDNAKQLAGCPDAPPDFAFVCDLPDMIPGQAVATSVAVGPDGAWYVGELRGFPAPTGMSKVWRIEPGTRHAHCGSDPRCTVAFDGFLDRRPVLHSRRHAPRYRDRRGELARARGGCREQGRLRERLSARRLLHEGGEGPPDADGVDLRGRRAALRRDLGAGARLGGGDRDPVGRALVQVSRSASPVRRTEGGRCLPDAAMAPRVQSRENRAGRRTARAADP